MRIAITSATFSKNQTLRDELTQLFPDSAFNGKGKKLYGRNLVEFLRGAEGAIVGLEKIDGMIVNDLPCLKIISKFGVGIDNVDVKCCRDRGIAVGWTPGVNKTSVAEMTLAFMIMLMRNLFSASFELKKGIWNKNGGLNLTGKTVGIIGVGNIGKEVVRLLAPFACNILVNDIIDQKAYYEEHGLTFVSKGEIYAQSDIVTLHVPFDDSTKYLINREALTMMKDSAFLINTSRGVVVKSSDLAWALRRNVIAGAALDVYEVEPPADPEFLNLPNLICTPHIGGNSLESVLSMGRSAIEHLRHYFCQR
jgi:phosphoglycerate dehydrogenase-like enzyme